MINRMLPRQLKFIPILFLIIITSKQLSAIKIESGLTFAPGIRSTDRFDRGMNKFHSSLNPNYLSASRADPFRDIHMFEAWIRFGELLGDDHFVGLSIGDYKFPSMNVAELRSNPAFVQMNWSFKQSYFMFTYHYIRPLKLRIISRAWNWEIGGGLGFLTGVRWRMKGYKFSSNTITDYSSSHKPDSGNIWRLEAGLKRPLTDIIILRFGLRVSYLYTGNFSGTLNGTDADWYYARDGGLSILSASQLLFLEPITSLEGPFQYSVVSEEANMTSGITEFYISIGARF